MAAVFSGFAPYVPVRYVRGTGTQSKARFKIASIMTGDQCVPENQMPERRDQPYCHI
jgi:hypothetical protein